MTIQLIYAGLFALALCVDASAQSLSIAQSTAKPGGSGSLLLSLDSAAGKAAVALQWRFIFPKNLTVALVDIAAGAAAESVEKSLTCALFNNPMQTGSGSSYTCVLAGGKQPIPSGVVATVRYHIPPGVSQIPDKVRVINVLAVTGELKQLEVPNAQGAVLVQ